MVLFPLKMDTPFANTEMTLCVEQMDGCSSLKIPWLPSHVHWNIMINSAKIQWSIHGLGSLFKFPQATSFCAYICLYYQISITSHIYTISVICIIKLSWFLPNLKALLLRSKGGEYKRLIRMHVGWHVKETCSHSF